MLRAGKAAQLALPPMMGEKLLSATIYIHIIIREKCAGCYVVALLYTIYTCTHSGGSVYSTSSGCNPFYRAGRAAG